jgi:hypothetical protein
VHAALQSLTELLYKNVAATQTIRTSLVIYIHVHQTLDPEPLMLKNKSLYTPLYTPLYKRWQSCFTKRGEHHGAKH